MKHDEFAERCSHPEDGNYCFGPDEPDYLAAIPVEERAQRVLMDDDLCIVDERHFFIRGSLKLPILGTSNVFSWLVWVSLSKKSLDRAVELWETPGRENEPPFFGWLNSLLPTYPDTLELKTNVHTKPVGIRPLIELERTNHPLSIDQREGITIERAKSLAKQVMLEWTQKWVVD